jgi:hypothetical protein
MKITKYPIICLVGLLLDPICLQARPVPVINLTDLAASADLIAGGEVTSIRQIGIDIIEDGSEKVPCRVMAADLRVVRILKGSASTPVLSLQFIEPYRSGESMGYQTPQVSLYRIFFLKQVEGTFRFVSPFYPSIPAVRETISGSEPIVDQMVHQLAAVIESRDSSSEQKSEAVWILRITKVVTATEALKKASDNQDASVRFSAIAGLLQRNDISKIDVAADELLRSTEDSEIRQNLLTMITYWVADPKATPALIRLMQSNDVLARRSGISALIRTRSPEAVPALMQALDDKDSEVRFNAIVALAEINQQPEWKPDKDQFQANERPYLEHWRSWAKRQ